MTGCGKDPAGPAPASSPAGSLLAAAGAATLAVSVFLPWYSVSLTATGVATAQQGLDRAAREFGNGRLQGLVGNIDNSFSGLVGYQVGTVSAHQALKVIGYLLLILAAFGLVLALTRLAQQTPAGQGRGQLATAGGIAVLLIVYRMVVHPAAPGGVFAVSLSWGSWVALLSAAAVVAGDLWPGRPSAAARDAALRASWKGY